MKPDAYVLSRVVEQPLKIPYIAAIVMVINQKKPAVTEEVLAKIGSYLQDSLRVGEWRGVKLLLRFLACVQGLLQADGVFPILGELFDRAVDLQTASSEDVRAPLLRLFSQVLTSCKDFGLGAR